MSSSYIGAHTSESMRLYLEKAVLPWLCHDKMITSFQPAWLLWCVTQHQGQLPACSSRLHLRSWQPLWLPHELLHSLVLLKNAWEVYLASGLLRVVCWVQKQYAGGEAFEYSERITWRKVLPSLHRLQTSRCPGPDAGPQQPR